MKEPFKYFMYIYIYILIIHLNYVELTNYCFVLDLSKNYFNFVIFGLPPNLFTYTNWFVCKMERHSWNQRCTLLQSK